MFTYDYYSSLVQTFIDCNYHFSFFEHTDHVKCIYLRHDVDFDIFNVLKMAEIENEKGVASTWFFQPNNDFYNMLSKQCLSIIDRTYELGHRIGLHIDAGMFDTFKELTEEINLLYDFYIRYIPVEKVISFHRPAPFLFNDFTVPGFTGTYEAQFFKEIAYVSDSARRRFWEEGCLKDALEKGRSLQMLTHPVWWKEKEYSLEDIIAYMRFSAKSNISDYALKNNCKVFSDMFF